MRRFYVRAFDDAGHQIMSSIVVDVPAAVPLHFPNERMNDGRQADFNAVAYVTGRVAEEFARYGASECVLAYEPLAQGIEARRAETVLTGSVHESPVASGDAPQGSNPP